MNNTEKKLDALIDVLGFDVEIIHPVPVKDWSAGVVYDMQTKYKLTKRKGIFMGNWKGTDIYVTTEQEDELREMILYINSIDKSGAFK